MLRHIDWLRINEFIRVLYEDTSRSRFRRLMPNLLDQLVPFDTANLFHEVNYRCRQWVRFDNDFYVGRGISSKWIDRYTKHYSSLDPVPYLKLISEGTVCRTVDECVDRRLYDRSEFFNDFLRPQNIYHELFVFLRIDSNPYHAVRITLMRSPREPNFTMREREIISALSPHLANAIRQIATVSAKAEQRHWLDEACREARTAILVTDPFYRIRLISEEARAIVRFLNSRDSQAEPSRHHLPAEIREIVQALGSRRRGSVSRAVGPFLIEGKPLPSLESRHPRFLIHIRNRAFYPDPVPSAQTFGLSAQECRVSQLVAQGLGNKEIASRMCLSVYTVADHIKHIFQKCGAHSRTEMVRLLFLSDSTRPIFEIPFP